MDTVEEVKTRLSIEDVVGEYVDLKRSGAGLKGLCPFHQEKTPSFYVSPSRGTFHCFGCGQGGDILSFVQAYDKLDFRDALRTLAEKAGVEVPDESARREQASIHERLYLANDAAAEFYRDQLKNASGRPVVEYLVHRRISAQVQHAFSLGWAPDSRGDLHAALNARGFTDDELLRAGLIRASSSSDGTHRDQFHARLMFPIRDGRGRITGFGGRIVGSGEPKYLNTPATAIFDKSKTLYGIDQALNTMRESRMAVVVEGYIDAIRAHSAGFRDVVASLGTAITSDQLQACARHATTVVLALDPDPAGQMAAVRTALSALASLPRRQQQLPDSQGRRMVDVGLGVDLRIASIPPGAGDPDELIERDPAAWKATIAESVPAFEYYFDVVTRSVNRSEPSWRQDVISRVLPVIQDFPFALGTQAAWIERLGSLTGIRASLLQTSLRSDQARSDNRTKRALTNRLPTMTPPAPKGGDPEVEAQRSLLQILLQVPLSQTLAPAVSAVEPSNRELKQLFELVVAQAGSRRKPNLSEVTGETRRIAEELISLPLDELPEARIEPAVRLHLASIRLGRIKRRLEAAQQFFSEVGEDDRPTAKRQLSLLLEERLDIEQQMDRLQREVIAGI